MLHTLPSPSPRTAVDALAPLQRHWHSPVADMGMAVALLGINLNTFKTRLKRGQALVRRQSASGRVVLGFTGYQLVFNLIADRLLRYGFGAPGDEMRSDASLARAPHVHAEWVFHTVLCPPRQVDAVLEFRRYADGSMVALGHERAAQMPVSADGALVLPIGRMVVQLADGLFGSGQAARPFQAASSSSEAPAPSMTN